MTCLDLSSGSVYNNKPIYCTTEFIAVQYKGNPYCSNIIRHFLYWPNNNTVKSYCNILGNTKNRANSHTAIGIERYKLTKILIAIGLAHLNSLKLRDLSTEKPLKGLL